MNMTEIDKNKIAKIAKHYNLALVLLFGSRARGDARARSDFDIAYSSITPMDLEKESRMAVEFHETLKTPNVDLVNLSNTGPLLLKKIVDESVVLYEIKQSIFNNLFLYATRIYRESEFLNTLRRDFVLNRINQYKKDVA